MKIYMDCCCLNRPFDDQAEPIIHLEAEAVKIILALCEQKIFTLISSQILKFEIGNTPNISRREKLKLLENIAQKVIKIDDKIEGRAKYFENLGVQAFDALHLACAEGNADVFLTVDNKLLKRIKKIKDLKIKVRNPLEWLEEVYYGKNN